MLNLLLDMHDEDHKECNICSLLGIYDKGPRYSTHSPSNQNDQKYTRIHFTNRKCPIQNALGVVSCSDWSELQVLLPRFGPKRNSKTPFDHPPPTANFWKGSRPSRRLIFDM